jgi:hypothetical protein
VRLGGCHPNYVAIVVVRNDDLISCDEAADDVVGPEACKSFGHVFRSGLGFVGRGPCLMADRHDGGDIFGGGWSDCDGHDRCFRFRGGMMQLRDGSVVLAYRAQRFRADAGCRVCLVAGEGCSTFARSA